MASPTIRNTVLSNHAGVLENGEKKRVEEKLIAAKSGLENAK